MKQLTPKQQDNYASRPCLQCQADGYVLDSEECKACKADPPPSAGPTKIRELLKVLDDSCQSEAIAIAETIRDSLDGYDDNPTEHATAIAEEFRDWGQSLVLALRDGHF